MLQGIDFDRVQIDNILCESHCAHVLTPLGYRPFRLGTMENDLLWRRLPLPESAIGMAAELPSRSDASPGYSLSVDSTMQRATRGATRGGRGTKSMGSKGSSKWDLPAASRAKEGGS